MFHVDFKMFIDKPGVAKRIDKKRRRVLAKAGGYARTAMQRQLRPPKSGKKARTVDVDGRLYLVPVRGMVVDAKTGKPCSGPEAYAARLAMASKIRKERDGKPPHRGPTDLLRKHIYFGLPPTAESVVIGPMKFAKQPRLSGASSVPELLEFGGQEELFHTMRDYIPHPFVIPTLPIAEKKFRELVESEKL